MHTAKVVAQEVGCNCGLMVAQLLVSVVSFDFSCTITRHIAHRLAISREDIGMQEMVRPRETLLTCPRQLLSCRNSCFQRTDYPLRIPVIRRI
jgi:hypothetical protein